MKITWLLLFLAVVCSALGQAAAQQRQAGRRSPADALVGQWRFDDCDGKTVRDHSPLGNHGRIASGEIRREKKGISLELDGLDGYVSIAEKTPLPLAGAVSTTLWIKPFSLEDFTPLFGIPNPNESWTTPVFGMYASQQRIVYGMWNNHGMGKVLVETPSDCPRGVWTFLASTYDGAMVRLYVDGVRVAEKPHAGNLWHTAQPLLIGKGLGSNRPSFKGRIGELRIYARGLSAAEVRAIYAETSAGYDLTPPRQPLGSKDRTVIVETHGYSPADSHSWRQQPTRLLELLDGYRASGAEVRLDRFGGRLDRPQEKVTGFFYVKQIGGRQWLIDPEGHRFFHVAMNAVREPRKVERNFGSAGQWAETLMADLRANHFNGLGNGQSKPVGEVRAPLVWVLRKDFMFAFAREKKLTVAAAGTLGFVDSCMPVFHADFPAFCQRFGADLAATSRDPHLLGIMTDNELQCPVNLLDRYLGLDASNADLRAGRDAAAAWLTARKGSLDVKGITRRDRYEFIAFAFERYYRIVTKVVRKYDPNHLYLGSRINYHSGEFDNPWFWKALAPYHDVVSVNFYGIWGPQQEQFAEWARWSGRPILLTEWYAKAADVPGLANTKGAGWLVHTQEDRGRYYQHFALNALEIPTIVGWHWFKYLDDPPESKSLDSAGGANKGMYDVEGRPYLPLVERARAVNREVYPLIEFFDARGDGGRSGSGG